MSGHGMDRRISGIIRWLERCRNSYKSGAMESALMDAECARADLEDLRLDVWSRVQEGYVPRRFRIVSLLGAFFLLPMLMVMATPSRIASRVPRLPFEIEFDSEPYAKTLNPAVTASEIPANIAAATTEEPAEPVQVAQVASASSATMPQKPIASTAKKSRPTGTANASTSRVDGQRTTSSESVPGGSSKAVKTSKTKEIPTYDTMIALFQTGQRALKGN